jgi:hypothetical protein
MKTSSPQPSPPSCVGKRGSALRRQSTRRSLTLSLVVALLSSAFSIANAAEPTAAEIQFFETKIRPILADRCYDCHSQKSTKLKGGLSVEYNETLRKGGHNGPAIVPGDLEKSLLIKAIRYTDPDLQMPPKGDKLSPTQVADLETWVKMGAPDPRKAGASSYAKDLLKNSRDHWAFQPLKKTSPPTVKNPGWVKTPVDSFILAKLEENEMTPSPAADKRTLIRRATFDLTGLPPTVDEVNKFLDDNSPDAFAKVVDRLLASPQYGEHWGRHWLDVARYADTKGDVNRNRDVPVNPSAWTYRDYVIQSFNQDKPFNKFIIEQLAADKLTLGTNRWTLAALGFLSLGDRFNNNRHDIINDIIDTVTKATMGLTVSCARCHDHKFDPISQKDYYALHGVFSSSMEPEYHPYIGQIKNTPDYQEYAKEFNELVKELEESKKTEYRRKSKQEREEEIRIRREIARLDMTHPGAPPRAPVVFDTPKPRDSRVFIRGEAGNPGELVRRRFLEIFSGTNSFFKSGSGRYELAQSIVHPNNPITPRVLVNRAWLHHFGEGIVTTPDDFGTQATPPSHPELLDYLASRFIQDGWSMKKLHRLIMLSSAYQQNSDNNRAYAKKDPQNRLLWRANIRRLDLESVRDSLLAIGGELDLTLGGRPVDLGAPPYSPRRTIYGYVDRRNLPEIYTQFDFANPDLSTGKRYNTTVPQQALFMMNSPLVVELARHLVGRPEFELMTDAKKKISDLYQQIYQRDPTAAELQLGVEFIKESPASEKMQVNPRDLAKDMQRRKRSQGRTAMSLATLSPEDLKPLKAWERYAHALLQANEVLFVN